MFGKKEKSTDLEFFTVFDSKSSTYSEPFPAVNKDVVIRDFATAFKHPEAALKNRYFQNAEDFALFRVGTFCVREGKITAENPTHCLNLHDLRAAVQSESGPRAL
nr:MAG: nonstructural protein [Microvirus sp.]